ncbi:MULTISPECIES: hypothetical protein [Gammaproteobacteria]|uniref:hypothetical protein n=1 Tax=Gammaproteobacteria TaxID=1236 RepID=UPI0019147FFC|nr:MULTISPECIES: hypothetical protein [Gammaproteobacteria]MBK5300833.1 hypothetical protein [Bacillus sp. TH86]MBK5320602.1 hypothetical protein [Bacillus sp. TH59]MBK5335552.1 hypothetical protein [Bacillus sp. TH57]MBK5309634.1 hypothetical protein [Pseudomonas sp. TH71]MBK5315101.1 hypothetical protein [Erwinia sp. TH79]
MTILLNSHTLSIEVILGFLIGSCGFCVELEKPNVSWFVTIDTYGHWAENMALVLFLSKGTYAPASTFPHCRLLVASRPDGMWRLIYR